MLIRRTLSRSSLLKQLAAIDRMPGTTLAHRPSQPLSLPHQLDPELGDALRAAGESSPTGSVVYLASGGAVTLALPPFPVERAYAAERIDVAPLRALLERDRAVAVFLLRLGGFSVGFFRGDALIDSKTDQRFVKNRHRKGGQSQRRFERIREKQIDELFDKACATAKEKLAPYDAEIDHLFLGGDRHTLQAFRKVCPWIDRFGDRFMARMLPVAGDPRRSSLDAAPRAIWSSEVWFHPPGEP
jgi:hypothetical protein